MVEKAPVAFKSEFYERANQDQIRDDVVSYLGEYRFQVPEFNYKIGISDGKLVDPNTKEQMNLKAEKAIEERLKNGLDTKREEAELEGLLSLEYQLGEKRKGSVIWFSPPGKKEDGYGDYGFAFIGEVKEEELQMKAVRLQNPSIDDFNNISKVMLGLKERFSETDFLKNPQILEIPREEIENYVKGIFEIKSQKENEVFKKAIHRMDSLIDDSTFVLRYGSPEQKRKAMAVLENISIELKEKLSQSDNEKLIFFSDRPINSLREAMLMRKYTQEPPKVLGSCGMTGRMVSANTIGNLLGSPKGIRLQKSQEWFTCPKCTYKADGPVGNSCPGCGLTKEQYAKDGGKTC